jgi:predicted HD phosphohydrolase
MEDEGFVDDSFIEETAWEYVSRHGRECVTLLRRLADAAQRAGDALQAQTWRAIAEAAERIINLDQPPAP